MGCRHQCQRNGHTVAEIVVIVLTALAIAILFLPSLGRSQGLFGNAIEAGRRTVCMNQLRQLAFANANYETARNRYPGAIEIYSIEKPNEKAGVQILIPWSVSLLPYLERQDLYDQFTTTVTNKTETHLGDTYPRGMAGRDGGDSLYWKRLRCPSDPPKSTADGQSSYICNGGSNLTNGKADGVFLDRAVPKPPIVQSKDIFDGLSNTIAFSENLLALEWSDVSSVRTYNTYAPEGEETSRRFARIPNSFIWLYGSDKPAADNPQIQALDNKPRLVTPVPANAKINGNRENSTKIGTDETLLRPSSNHPGGVCAAFLDGHAQFLRETIDYRVYQQLLTPYHKKSFAPHSKDIFDEEDLD